jgi:hypothetical protein
MTQEIQLSDYSGNYEAFCEACYQAYLAFWLAAPTFEGKRIQHNASKISRGKEDDFWGIVDGHDATKEHEIERYCKVPLLGYVLSSENVTAAGDVLFIKRLHKRKIRIEVFSQSKRYLVVLQEVGKSHLQFITAHPLEEWQLKKKLKNYEEFKKSGFKPL